MMTKDFVRVVGAEVIEALKGVADKHGIAFKLDGGSFAESYFTLKLQGSRVGSSGEAETKEAATFRLYAPSYQLAPTDLGRVFTSNGEQYKIAGLNPRRSANPILLTRVRDGRSMKASEKFVRRALDGAPTY